MTLETALAEISRIGMGCVFLSSIFFDIKTRTHVFDLMQQRNISNKWVFFTGGVLWKAVTSIALICNFHTFFAALLLALYIFVANIVFNDFWAVPKEQRDCTLIFFITHLGICFGLLATSSIYA